jgi:hypothetical protein
MSFFGDALFISAAIIMITIGVMLWVKRFALPQTRAEFISAIFGLAAITCAMFAIGTSETSEKLITAPMLSMLALSLIYGTIAWIVWQIASHNGSDLA